MAPRRKSDSYSLQAHDIYFTKRQTVGNCPAAVQDLFKLVIGIKDLKADHFGGYEKAGSNHSLLASTKLPRFSPRQQYEKELKFDAYELSATCSDKRRADDNEGKWERVKHLNLPNFDTVSQLAYPEFENEGKKIPDMTIGLHSYDLNQWINNPDLMLLRDDRVRMFDQKLLRKLEDEGYITPPFCRPGSHRRSVSDMPLTFPFAFWEAKREGGGSDHQSAETQNAIKVKMILDWQDKISKSANVPWCPLVWYFVSVGSKWEIHGCHFQENNNTSDGRICVLILLWSGDSANIDEALQLLYIVDIIALWGEHMYKPFAGACIRRLEAELNDKPIPRLKETLLAHQMEINKETFPWLFPEPQSTQLVLPAQFNTLHQSWNFALGPWNRSTSLQSPRLLRGVEQFSITTIEPGYIIPERDYFIWILNRDHNSYNGDLLIVRVSQQGRILPPLVVFSSPHWKRRDFREVVKQERARTPDKISTDFRIQQDGSSFIKKCVLQDAKYFRESQTQFCAIIPLDPKAYGRQRGSDFEEDTTFGQFETLLALPRLIRDAEKANKLWCKCRIPYNEHSPDMIQCDNLKCPIGWYHNKCVGLDEGFTADLWLCKNCSRNRPSNELSDFDNDDEEIDEEIREASDARIQRVKTLARVWEEHDWPSTEKVCQKIDSLSCRIIMKQPAKNPFDTFWNPKVKDCDESNCLVVLRGIPKVTMAVRPRERKPVRKTNYSV
ncbi:hypothetical protein N431DRAFT_543234 [Stipitochalara longipes BDJ]|nr:hypothetical protein N431DRAFT_543234 [Stipitochalara longipes BDJ]